MTRTAINHLNWNRPIYNQGEVIQGATRILNIAGQVSVEDAPDEAWGVRAKHPGDMRAQFADVLAHLDKVLDGAGMGRGDLTSLTFYVTDVEAGLEHFDVFTDWIGDARPPQSFIGVSQIALPGLMIEVSGTAAQ